MKRGIGYILFLFVLISAEPLWAITVTSGQLVTSTIATPADRDTYSFAAAAGDSINVSVGDTHYDAYFYPMVKLYAPDGTQLGSNYGSNGAWLGHRATATGTYTAVVLDAFTGSGGDYLFTMVKAPGAQSDPDGRAIQSGEVISRLLVVGDMDVFTFTAAAGDSISVSVGDTQYDAYFYPMVWSSTMTHNWVVMARPSASRRVGPQAKSTIHRSLGSGASKAFWGPLSRRPARRVRRS